MQVGCVKISDFRQITSYISKTVKDRHIHTHTRLTALFPGLLGWAGTRKVTRSSLLPSDRTMRLVSSNLANYHATVQKLLIRQVLTKPMVWSWRLSWRHCVINKPTTVELCISPVYRPLAVAKFFKVHNVGLEITHVTLTTPTIVNTDSSQD